MCKHKPKHIFLQKKCSQKPHVDWNNDEGLDSAG